MRRGIVATAGAFGVAALVWAAVALADDVNCNGGGKQCNGTPFDDFITGSNKVDVINAKAGVDDARAKNGNDKLEMGAGNDYVEGGKGNDEISGGDDSDEYLIGGLFGGPGDDLIEGGEGSDDIYGEAGKDFLVGGPGDDQLDASGFELTDTKDRVSCGGGFDTVFATQKDSVPNDCEDVLIER